MDLISLGNYFFAEWLREKNKKEKDVSVKINSSRDLIFQLDTMIDEIRRNCGNEKLRIELCVKHFPLISYTFGHELPLTYKGIPIYFHGESNDGSDLLHVFVNKNDFSRFYF